MTGVISLASAACHTLMRSTTDLIAAAEEVEIPIVFDGVTYLLSIAFDEEGDGLLKAFVYEVDGDIATGELFGAFVIWFNEEGKLHYTRYADDDHLLSHKVRTVRDQMEQYLGIADSHAQAA